MFVSRVFLVPAINDSLKIVLCFFLDNSLGDIYDYMFPMKEYHIFKFASGNSVLFIELHNGYIARKERERR